MNLSIVLMDFINLNGILRTYRFIPINEYNRVVVDRISDIFTDVKGNMDKDVGLLRIYNSNKCQLFSTTCKIREFKIDDKKNISFEFKHMYIPVGFSYEGGCGFHSFVLPIGYRLTKLHIVDPFDVKNKQTENKKHFRSEVFWMKKVNFK